MTLSGYKATKEWHNRIGDMLTYVNDVLVPHGFDEIVKDDFAALRQHFNRAVQQGHSICCKFGGLT